MPRRRRRREAGSCQDTLDTARGHDAGARHAARVEVAFLRQQRPRAASRDRPLDGWATSAPPRSSATSGRLSAPMQNRSAPAPALGSSQRGPRDNSMRSDDSGLETIIGWPILPKPDRRFVPSPKPPRIRCGEPQGRPDRSSRRNSVTSAVSMHRSACGSPWRGSPTRSGASTLWASRRDRAPEDRGHRFRQSMTAASQDRCTSSRPSAFLLPPASAPSPASSRTLGSLLVGLEEEHPRRTGLDRSSAVRPEANAGVTANVRIQLPLARLAAAEDAAERRGRLRVCHRGLAAAGKDAGPHPFEVREQLIDVPLPVFTFFNPSGAAEFVVTVPLSAGHREIAVGVHDLFSELVSYRAVSR